MATNDDNESPVDTLGRRVLLTPPMTVPLTVSSVAAQAGDSVANTVRGNQVPDASSPVAQAAQDYTRGTGSMPAGNAPDWFKQGMGRYTALPAAIYEGVKSAISALANPVDGSANSADAANDSALGASILGAAGEAKPSQLNPVAAASGPATTTSAAPSVAGEALSVPKVDQYTGTTQSAGTPTKVASAKTAASRPTIAAQAPVPAPANLAPVDFDNAVPTIRGMQQGVDLPGGPGQFGYSTVSTMDFQAALQAAQNPKLAPRLGIHQNGFTLDGVPVNAGILTGRPADIESYLKNYRQAAIRSADPLAAQVAPDLIRAEAQKYVADQNLKGSQASSGAQVQSHKITAESNERIESSRASTEQKKIDADAYGSFPEEDLKGKHGVIYNKKTGEKKPVYEVPTEASIQKMLQNRKNPQMRADFDAKFGPGAAKRVLGED